MSLSVLQTPAVGAGLFEAVAKAASGEWFGPGSAPNPQAQGQAQGRAFDFTTGYNLQIRPKPYEGVTFTELRNLADGYDLLRLVIETRKDQIEKLAWDIKKRGEKVVKRGATPDPRIERVRDFLAYPDREHPFGTWIRMLTEDVLVIDAPAVYVRRTLGGDLFALETIDGATIKRILDPTGRTPLEGPAYQQVLKGVVAAEYTREELLYMPRNPRTHKAFGFGPVEQVMTTVNIALRRQLHQLSYYTDGSTPNLIFSVPKEWDADQVKRFQDNWDSVLAGNSTMRARTRFVPGETKPIDTKENALKDDYDEWLARIVCFAFSISPTALVKETNRATAQTVQQAALSEGLAPLQNWIKALMDRILREVMEAPDLEFVWAEERSLSAKERAEVDEIDTRSGVRTVSECREDRGMEGLGEEPEDDSAGLPGAASGTVQDTAMNGAQVSSLIQIVESAASGAFPKETAQAIIQASFPALGQEQITAIISPIQVKEPNPAPLPVVGTVPPPAAPGKEAETGEAGEAAASASPAASKVACACGHDISLHVHAAEAGQIAKFLKRGLVAKASKIKPIKRDRPTIKKLEAKIRKTVAACLTAQVRPLAEAIHAELGKAEQPSLLKRLKALVGLEKMSREEALKILETLPVDLGSLGDDLEPILAAIAQDGGSQALAQLGKTTSDLLDQVNEQSVAWAEKHAADLVTKLTETTRDSLRSVLSQGIEEGMSVDELAGVLSESFGFSDRRAELIAQTERAFADVRGNTLGYAASGVVGGLKWICANGGDDERTCADCEMNDGAEVGMSADGTATEAFPSGAITVPAHPGCLCDLLPVLSEEV